MGCRVGMTTDITTRKEYWEKQYPSMKNWKILKKGLTKDEAQELEKQIAIAHTCDSNPGGDDPDDKSLTWAVYRFEF